MGWKDRMTLENHENSMRNSQNQYKLLENYKESLEQFGKLKSGHMAAKILLKIGDLYKDLNNHQDAMENYNLALKLNRDEKNIEGEALTLKSIGNLWNMGKEYSEARSFYQQSLRKYQMTGNSKMERKVSKLISNCYQAEGALEDAIKVLEDVNKQPLAPQQFFLNQFKIKVLTNKISNIKPTKIQSLMLLGYLLVLIAAEFVNNYYSTSGGIILQVLIIVSLIISSTLTKSHKFSYFLQSLILLPLIRIMGISIPVMEIEPLYWLVIMACPILVAVVILMRSQHIGIRLVGLNTQKLALQLSVGLTGLFFGLMEYLIIKPAAIIPKLDIMNFIFASLIVIISTGLLEELVFRGIIQRNAENIMGKIWGIIFVSILFTALNAGWNSTMEIIFIFGVSLFYGYIFQKTRSIVGISISHGLCNVVLFLFLPFII